MAIEFIPYRPALEGRFAKRFYDKFKFLADTQPDFAEIQKLTEVEVCWATDEVQVNPKQRRIYRAAWMLFRDLVRTGWKYRWVDRTLEITPPSPLQNVTTAEKIEEAKNLVRNMMATTRQEKLYDSRDFIRRMENPSDNNSVSVDISGLLADGKQLANDLYQISKITDNEIKLKKLNQIIQPYLQLIKTNERCEYTGHRLSDIWRYFRLTWATPAETTPGRTLQYLIRDAARPNHPIMGIASLENAPLRIECRDNELGWTLESFKSEIRNKSDERIRASFEYLVKNIDKSIVEIDLSGICEPDEIENPTRVLFEKLTNIIDTAYQQREKALKEWYDYRNSDDESIPEIEQSELGNTSYDAEKALYLRKRAERLKRLLFARTKLRKLLGLKDFSKRWQQFMELQVGQSIIREALKTQKNLHIGTSMLELNICGAIPPYNHILSGKLTALMILSPQIVNDYRERYGGRASDIASRIKGEDVVRPAELIYIGTTSLYTIGASQYNRLKIPDGLLKDDAPELKWNNLGYTKGYGTLHISRQTLKYLEDAASNEGVVYVHHIFGEGASPKLRALRQGLDVVLEKGQRFSSVELTQHTMNRLVYGFWLATNGKEIFRGQAVKPDYYFDTELDPIKATEKIVEYWRERWLLMRLNHKPSLERIADFDSQSLLLGNNLIDPETVKFKNIPDKVITMPEKPDDLRAFVRSLYLNTGAYADNMEQKFLETIHAKTRLDEAVIKAIKNGKSVILTGNPGDGKTHLIRILSQQFEKYNVNVVKDASEKTDEEVYTQWVRAIEQDKPFCVAINEAVLFKLADQYEQFQPLQEAISQVESAVMYDKKEAKGEDNSSVVVFDLSLRNVLSEDIINAVLDKLTVSDTLASCSENKEDDDLYRNQQFLQVPLVRERLYKLLKRVSDQGHHVTLRQLQAFISFLLMGDRSCQKILQSSGSREMSLAQLPFKGKKGLFDLLKQTFDPARTAHPIWDERLINADTTPDDWIPEWRQWYSETESIDSLDWKKFSARKRAFYFFHKDGDALLKIADDDETEFAQFLEKQPREALRLIIPRINLFFGDVEESDAIRVWQGHRYGQIARPILYSYSAFKRKRTDFEIVKPRLRKTMQDGFDLAQDHVLMRLKEKKEAQLRIDFPMFRLLVQAERGVPVMSLESDVTRRLWQFMEKLVHAKFDLGIREEIDITILDPSNMEKLDIKVDTVENQYLSITPR